MNEDLQTYFEVDLEEVIEDLRIRWLERDESKFNSNAFTKLKRTGDDLMFCCPFHPESRPSFGIKTEYPYVYNCFGCSATGTLVSLVTQTLGMRSELLGLQFILKNYVLVDAERRHPIDVERILDRGRASVEPKSEEDLLKFTKKRHTYIYSRGFSERTLKKYEIGYDEETKTITIPVRDSKGNLRFIKRRSVLTKKFLNEKGIPKKDLVYGLYYILQSHTPIYEVFLTESEFDTLSLYEAKLPAVAIMGRTMFLEQVRELVKAGIKRIKLFLDNDRAGLEGTFQVYKMLSEHSSIVVDAVIYPGGHFGIDVIGPTMYKDANDLLLAGELGNIEVVQFLELLSRVRKANLIKI